MRLHGSLGDIQLGRNLFVALAVHNLFQHVEFARCQLFGAHALGQPLRNGRRNMRLAGMHSANGRNQLIGGHALQ